MKNYTLTQFLKSVIKMATDEQNNKAYFSTVYADNAWGGKHSRSGPGSEGEFARQKINIIQELVAALQIKKILDIGCGDFYWMQELAPQLESYCGFDISDELIAKNTQQHAAKNVSFVCADLTQDKDRQLYRDLAFEPDLVMSLDVFGHLLNDELDRLLEFIVDESHAKFWLVTNRRDAKSADYLHRPKSRFEGVDLEVHPTFKRKHPQKIKQIAAMYEYDFFELYSLDN